ncbi:hypothetical protein IWQ62_001392 [Dispira parvispora]|uniref:Ubiquitin-protein ligase E3A N-terminal zinc-binding domain-containing protein n=1 Tax=Dispira parvispora TaxID=1520584 RepID=A0A9W8E943_9FUNG|nr:hypothetical protein IWQ62_001392 [Dispira parvispora]
MGDRHDVPHFSGRFHVYPHSSQASVGTTKDLNQTDRLVLPVSVLEHLLFGRTNRAGPAEFLRSTTMWDSGNGNSNRELPQPLTFRLVNPENRNSVCAGVEEFTADEQLTTLSQESQVCQTGPTESSAESTLFMAPQWVLDSLGVNPGEQVDVTLVTLPKATGARFRPLDAQYRVIRDFRSVFESHLRAHFTTLTVGETLAVQYGKLTLRFLVVDLQPEPAVTVVDTDIEVDIESFQEDGAKTDQPHVLSSIDLTHNDKLSYLSLDSPVTSEVAPGETREWLYRAQGNLQKVYISLEIIQGDVDLLVQIGEDSAATYEDHYLADFGPGPTRQVVLEPDTITNPSGEFRISVEALDQLQNEFRLNVSTTAPSTSSNTVGGPSQGLPSEISPPEGYETCPLCQAHVPKQSFTLHHSFCARNNLQCTKCGQTLRRGEQFDTHWHCERCEYVGILQDKYKHNFLRHQSRTCRCGFTSDDVTQFALHRRTECPHHMIICRYCHTWAEQGPPGPTPQDRLRNLREHEAYCGNRTIDCIKCHQPIKLKDMAVHAQLHKVRQQNQPLPFRICRNANCVRPRVEGPSANVLQLCATCFGPYWTSNLDPGHKKLLQRVALTYHRQLTQGCGHAWCHNTTMCSTATGKKLDPTSAALHLGPFIQSLARWLSDPAVVPNRENSAPWLYFCVDESTSQRALLVPVLDHDARQALLPQHSIPDRKSIYPGDGAEGKPTKAPLELTYPKEWLVKALMEANNDIDQAKAWLISIAPKPAID